MVNLIPDVHELLPCFVGSNQDLSALSAGARTAGARPKSSFHSMPMMTYLLDPICTVNKLYLTEPRHIPLPTHTLYCEACLLTARPEGRHVVEESSVLFASFALTA